MEWINLHMPTLRAPEYIGSDPVARATWIQVLAYCCEQENGGVIRGAARWKDRQWQQACGVTLAEILESSPLIVVSGDDVTVWRYPLDKEESVKQNRLNGKKGGRPKKPPQKPPQKPDGNQSVNRKETQKKPTAETEGEREGKSNGMEGEGNMRTNADILGSVDSEGELRKSPDDIWRYEIQCQPWVQGIKGFGGKIGSGNWQHWRTIIDTFGPSVVSDALKSFSGERWPDKIENHIKRSDPSAGNEDGAIEL